MRGDGRTPVSSAVGEPLRDDPRAIVVTGASGWFGRTALELLREALEPEIFDARVRAYASRRRTIELTDGTTLVAEGLASFDPPAEGTQLFLHLAALTRELEVEWGADRYLQASLTLTGDALRAIACSSPDALLYTSSGAVYGARRPTLETNVAENPYGFVKHLEEKAFRRTAEDVGGRCVIIRVFSGSGPHINKPRIYALRNLFDQAWSGDPIEIRARHRVVRTYAAVSDILSVGIATALDADAGHELFETGGEPIEIEELARRILAVVGRSHVPISRKLDPDLAVDDYSGNGIDMQRLADRYGIELLDLDSQLAATASAELSTRSRVDERD